MRSLVWAGWSWLALRGGSSCWRYPTAGGRLGGRVAAMPGVCAMSAPHATMSLLLVELSRLVGHSVELVHRITPSGALACLIAPVDRGRLQDGFWRAVRASPAAGIWNTPEAALVGFAASVAGYRAAAARTSPTRLEGVLRDRLAGGAQPAAVLLADFASQGVSRDRVGRAARRIGVMRRKTGMVAGWMWSQPEDSSVGSGGVVGVTGGNTTT